MSESSGYLALRWNNHQSIFATTLDDLRIAESYCDVTLSCGGQFFSAHKFVLATCSDYFKEMIARTPCKHPVVYMRDVSPHDMEALLDFMYKGEVHVAETEVPSLLRTAEGLQVKGLAVPDSPRVSSPVPQLRVPPPQLSTSPSRIATLVPKKKRSADGSFKKDEPPRLTPLPQNSGGAAGQVNSPAQETSPHGRLCGPPQLKRQKVAPSPVNGPCLASTSKASLGGISKDASMGNGVCFGAKEGSVDRSSSSSDDPQPALISPEKMPNNSVVGDDDLQRNEDCDEASLLSSVSNLVKEEVFRSNGPLDNDDDTNDVLQVDLSEDGSQFIIGPGGRFPNKEESLDDESGDNQKKPFVCPLCGHDFTRRDNLANHLKTHTGDRPHMCRYCQKCFSRKDYLKQHERIHTGVKPYQCQQCDRAFTRKEGLTDHMRCHSDFKEFTCDVCLKSFKQKCGLRFHKRNYKH
ncbi:protein tramtrack, beta isoform [Hyalella azteca]|uniref:Protein tramtrack, beta isoform n=1 Tax=Hyalella azteca TaxID=294128 RepID=A0A8B7PFW4_HYAAZ|nr:protein tramtrack, beta isoform [Hyalella azteca]